MEKGKSLPTLPDATSVKGGGREMDPAAALAHRMRKLLYNADNIFADHLEAIGAHREVGDRSALAQVPATPQHLPLPARHTSPS